MTKAPASRERKARRAARGLAYGVPVIIALLGPATFWDHGILEREATTFVRQYTAERSVLQKVFDPHANDFGTYQARELSYFLDFVDARFYAFLAKVLGCAFFIPLSALTASLLLVIVFMSGLRHTTTNVDPVTGALLLVCFLTSFGFVSTMGVFYRSGKPLLAAILLAWLFQIRWVQQTRSREPGMKRGRTLTREGMVTFALATIAGLLDRQGFFYVLAGSTILLVHFRTTGHLRDVLVGALAAAIVLEIYNLVVAPLAIHAINGYWPDFSYQMIPVSEMLRFQVHLSRAFRVLLANTALLLGGFRPLTFLLCGLILAIVWRGRRVREDLRRLPAVARSRASMSKGWPAAKTYLLHDRSGRLVLYGLLAFAAQLVMFALMIARHTYLYLWLDHRYWYYPLPYLTTVLFGLLLLLDASLPRLPAQYRRAVPVALLLVAIGNMINLDHYRQMMRGGPWFGPVYVQSEMLKASLRSGMPDPGLAPEYRLFFDHHQRLRAQATTSAAASLR